MMITRTSARLLAATLVLAVAASTASAAAAAAAAAAIAPLLCLLPGIGAECCDVDLALGGVKVAVVPGCQELADKEVPFGCGKGGDGANGGRGHGPARVVEVAFFLLHHVPKVHRGHGLVLLKGVPGSGESIFPQLVVLQKIDTIKPFHLCADGVEEVNGGDF